MPGVNTFAGEGVMYPGFAGGGAAVLTPESPNPGVIPDGTEWTVALIVLASLAFLVLLEVGGFKTIIAASVTR